MAGFSSHQLRLLFRVPAEDGDANLMQQNVHHKKNKIKKKKCLNNV